MNSSPHRRFSQARSETAIIADPTGARLENPESHGVVETAWMVLGPVAVLVASCLYYVIYVALAEHARQ